MAAPAQPRKPDYTRDQMLNQRMNRLGQKRMPPKAPPTPPTMSPMAGLQDRAEQVRNQNMRYNDPTTGKKMGWDGTFSCGRFYTAHSSPTIKPC